MINLLTNAIDCPLSCGYTTQSSSFKSEIISHLNLICPKRLLLDETIHLCEDPDNNIVLITKIEDHKETCNKCGNPSIREEKNLNDCDIGKNKNLIEGDLKSQNNKSKIFNKDQDKSLFDYGKEINKSKSKSELKKNYTDDTSIVDESDLKTNYTSGYPSVHDTMILTRTVDKREKSNFQINSFYDVSVNRNRNNKNNYRQGLNDTMIDEGEFNNNMNMNYNRFHKYPQRNLNRNSTLNCNSNDTMINDRQRNLYRNEFGYGDNFEEEIEEESEEYKQIFYFEGESEELSDIKEYFIN